MIYCKPDIDIISIESASLLAASFTGNNEPIGSTDYLENLINDNDIVGWD